MELRIRDGQAVLDDYQICDQESRQRDDASEPFFSDKHFGDKHLVDKQLVDELTEWAHVIAAVKHSQRNADHAKQSPETQRIIGQRGRQLAGRVADAMSTSINFVDPMTEVSTVVHPRGIRKKNVAAKHFSQWHSPNESVPWVTGLTVSAFAASVIAVALLALATLLAKEMPDWISLVITCLFGVGISPSLWLARAIPVIRWLALGAFIGLLIAVIGAFGITLR